MPAPIPTVACASTGSSAPAYLAVADLDGSPYLHLCENRPYEFLDTAELQRVVRELGVLGDQLEQVIASGSDSL